MNRSHEADKAQARPPAQSQKRSYRNLILAGLIGAVLLFIVLMNFVPFHVASSRAETKAAMETGRTGETLPANMTPGFTLYYHVEGTSELAAAVSDALPEALASTNVGEVAAVPDPNAVDGSRLLLTLDVEERLWTPVYGRARVNAVIYFANLAGVPWPQDKPMILTESPEIQARGEITLNDATWGLLSKPAYYRLLGHALADAAAANLQESVFQIP